MGSWSILAAWWGAVIATIVLLFDFYKWARSGPRIRCDPKYGWKMKVDGVDDDNEYIFFPVTNAGDRPTTITRQGALYSPDRIKRYFCKPKEQFFFKGGLHGMGKIPMIIKPGEIWDGCAAITDDMHRLMNKVGYLYLSLEFSHRQRPYLFKVTKRSKSS
jgi:hypothetical protein